MDDVYIGEIRCFPYDFAPHNWAFCSGQLLPVQQYDALFSLLGTYYGGDGRTTFALPDLRGRVPMHVGGQMGNGHGLSTYKLGQQGGQETVTLATINLPQRVNSKDINITKTGETQTVSVAEAASGGNQPVNTMPPFLGMNYCIALLGKYPPRS